MNDKVLFLFMALIANLSISSLACSSEAYGHIESLIVRSSDGLIYVWLDSATTSRPTCAANTNYWMVRTKTPRSERRHTRPSSLRRWRTDPSGLWEPVLVPGGATARISATSS